MLIPKDFPRMYGAPVRVDSLAWYEPLTPGLSNMKFEARDEVVELIYPNQKSNLVGVPRTLAAPCAPENDHRAVGEFEFTADFTSKYREEQVPFVEEVFNTLEREQGCIGQAPTGFGKTTIGCALIAKVGRPCCVVIPKGDLEWDKELLRHTSIPKNKIDFWNGQKLPDPEAWVVIASLQSVHRLGYYPEEVYRRFACLIVDEVHRVGSHEFSNVLRQFPAMFRLGLSADANRRDGKMPLIQSHIGWRTVKGKSDAQPPDYWWIPTGWREPHFNGKTYRFDPTRTNLAKKRLMADPLRNQAIAAAMYRAHRAGRRSIVFVEQLKHSQALKSALLGMGVPASLIIEYNGSTPQADRDRAKEAPEGVVLLATYKYTAEGTNIPALDCACLAHPIYDPRQPVGRILRKHPGKQTPIVIDVLDEASGALKNMAQARMKYVASLGGKIKGEFR